MGVLATLDAATPNRRVVRVITDAGVAAEHAAAMDELDAAAAADARDASFDDPHPNMTRAVDKLDRLRDRMLASAVDFTLQHIPWQDRVALQAAHPPRKGVASDAVGYNLDTYIPALLRASTVSVADAAGGDVQSVIPESTWVHLLGDPHADPPVKPALNFKAVNDLTIGAQGVNDENPRVPRSARSLLGPQDSGASSTPPSPGGSPHAGSEDGNPPTSPTSSTTLPDTSTPGSQPAT